MGKNLWRSGAMSFKEYNQQQTFLLPPALEDFVPADHLARVINEVVNRLDLGELYARYSAMGCSAYHPQLLVKVLFYGYATGERSSRKLAHRLQSDVAYMYLAGMQTPNFRTINRFRKDHLALLHGLFVQIVRLCQALGMVRVGLLALDGTKLKANASLRQSLGEEDLAQGLAVVEEEIQRILMEATVTDEREDAEAGVEQSGYELPEALRDAQSRKQRLQEARAHLAATGAKQVNLTDPDAPIMFHQQRQAQPSYNGQIAVDAAQGVIVAATVSTSSADQEALPELVTQTTTITGTLPAEVVADAGFASADNYLRLAEQQIVGYIPDPKWVSVQRGTAQHPEFKQQQFTYEEASDTYRCPQGKGLVYKNTQRNKQGIPIRIYQGQECPGCARRQECTTARYRRISRDPREAVVQQMRERVDSETGKQRLQVRQLLVEPIFGHLKHNWNFRDFLLRGKAKVTGEFLLFCIAYNLRKLAKWLLRVGKRPFAELQTA
jgi:transposase